MTDEEWEKQRNRAVTAAFQTGRPVFADTDGELRYADGAKETVPAEAGDGKHPVQRATTLAVRAERASHLAFVASVVAAIANAVSGLLWYPWQLVCAAVFVGSAAVFRSVNQRQRAASRGATR